MPFKSTYLKLTAFYVGILMLISIGFSLAIYNISSKEIDKGLGNQAKQLRQFSNQNMMYQDLEDLRLEQMNQSNERLRLNLLNYNLLILILSSVGSYFFARFTLKPIEEALDKQNRFTADASHELRTPLTAMRAEIEVHLRDKNLSILEAKTLLKSNLEEISKLEILSGALLKLAKSDYADRKNLNNISLYQVLLEASNKIEPLLKKKNINLNAKQNSPTDQILIKGDKVSLVELFVIILDNAIKYSPINSQITLKVEKHHGDVIVSIKDQGIGIKQSDLLHIFDRFYRADHSRNKEKVDGYGLGLSIAKNICQLHGGEIFAKSTPGKGSQFSVKLPLA